MSEIKLVWTMCAWIVALTQATYEQADADQLFILLADTFGQIKI